MKNRRDNCMGSDVAPYYVTVIKYQAVKFKYYACKFPHMVYKNTSQPQMFHAFEKQAFN